MKIAIIVAVLAIPSSAYGQKVGDVVAPNALTLRIVSVADISQPEQTSTGFSEANIAQAEIKKSVTGQRVVGESATVRYTLRCTVQHKEEKSELSTGVITTYFEDNWSWYKLFKLDKGEFDSPKIYDLSCGEFHVGDTITFYSRDLLIWLSITNTEGTFVHNRCWKPVEVASRFATMQCEHPPSAYEIQLHKQQGSDAPTRVYMEKYYSIESEEEIKRR